MLLVSNKAALFEIAIAHDAPAAVRYAAEELQRYIDRLSLAFPTIRTDDEPQSKSAILLGDSRHRAQLFPRVNNSKLPRDGYLFRQHNRHLLIWGGSPRGTLYGVYDLLERLGVRWWTPGEESVPHQMALSLDDSNDALNFEVSPPLFYRALWYRNAMDADWLARRRLSGDTMGPIHLRERHGGAERFAGDASGHTYEALVPTAKYFDSHPEYFSEVNGQRLRHMNQLCPTNPAVADIAAETIRGWLTAMPEARIASVTQNDWNNWCTCPQCTAIIEREGSTSGPALFLANEVARRLERDHPEVLIDTFAYTWTEIPPAHMEAHPNVLVRIAPIGNCFGHTIRTCPANERCRNAVREWAKRARHLFIWHYVTDFFHYMPPFPNLPPLQDDIDFYLQHGVKGIFLQGDGTSLDGDMAELKAYLMSRLLWNPQLDMAAARQEFLHGYYGAAGPAVDDLLTSFERAFAGAKDDHLFLYRSLWENEASYLTQSVLTKARTLLHDGRAAAGDDHDVQRRLDKIEAELDYTELFYYNRPRKSRLGNDHIDCGVSAQRHKQVNRFFAVAQRDGVTHYAEDLGRYTTIGSLHRAWQESIGTHRTLTLSGGGMRVVVVPHLGGRIIAYGPSDGKINLLGTGSPQTFGYPCSGGYEEYSLRPHQSPGFSEHFELEQVDDNEIVLSVSLETGLTMRRQVRIDAASGDIEVHAALINPHDVPLPGCLRPHLEIDLHTSLLQVETRLRRGSEWAALEGTPGGAWYEPALPDGWAFWSSRRKVGIWQTWNSAEVEIAVIGGIPSEASVLTLDLLHKRESTSIKPGGRQTMTHRFGAWLGEAPASGAEL
jgi:hypothetical protein